MINNQKDLCVEELLKNNLGLRVLTDTGWSDFSGLLVRGKKKTVVVQTATKKIICTPDHKFFKPNFEYIEAGGLKPRSKIKTSAGIESVVSVKLASETEVYDLFEVTKNHRFYANGILAKNCEFLIFDETLISSNCLLDMTGTNPIEKQGQVRWFKRPTKGNTYLIALDPSLGTGGDYAAIQVLELPSCTQVAEWQHNRTIIQAQIRVLKEICGYIYDQIGTETDIYYSLENNTLGEAALVTLSELGEENIRGIFLSEPAKSGTSRRYRKGFTTTNKSKLVACAKLKTMIEYKKMIVNSHNLISEFKNFVASGGSYAAKPGETDDLVMSLLLAVRMIQILQNYDPDLDLRLRGDDVDYIEPMPFIMLS